MPKLAELRVRGRCDIDEAVEHCRTLAGAKIAAMAHYGQLRLFLSNCG